MFIIQSDWFPSPLFGLTLMGCFFGWGFLEFINHLIGKWSRLGNIGHNSDGGSYWLLIVTVYGCFCLAYVGRFFGWGVVAEPVQYVGLGLMMAGIILREWAVLVLGRYFSVVVSLEANHRLIKRGPYRRLRHPAYTGGLLAVIGFTLALGTWLMLLPIIIILLFAFSYRIRLEEKLLLTAFGDTYRDYMAQTWRLFPGL